MISDDKNSHKIVLVVDDQPNNTTVLMIKKEGWNVDVYTDPQKAIDLIKSGKSYPVVISDFHMPEICGDAVCKAVKGFSPNTVVFLNSGENLDQDFIADLKIEGFYKKPLTIKDIREMLVLAEKRLLNLNN